MTELLDTTYYDRRLAEKLRDPDFEVNFWQRVKEIESIDGIYWNLKEMRFQKVPQRTDMFNGRVTAKGRARRS